MFQPPNASPDPRRSPCGPGPSPRPPPGSWTGATGWLSAADWV